MGRAQLWLWSCDRSRAWPAPSSSSSSCPKSGSKSRLFQLSCRSALVSRRKSQGVFPEFYPVFKPFKRPVTPCPASPLRSLRFPPTLTHLFRIQSLAGSTHFHPSKAQLTIYVHNSLANPIPTRRMDRLCYFSSHRSHLGWVFPPSFSANTSRIDILRFCSA